MGSTTQQEWAKSKNATRRGVNYAHLMNGTPWVNPNPTFAKRAGSKSKQTFENVYDDIHVYDDMHSADKKNPLSNMNTLTNVNPYMSLIIFQKMEKEGYPLKRISRSFQVKALLDTGSLAGDFISHKVVNIFNPIYIYETDFTVYSGMDGSCLDKLNAIDLYVSIYPEENNFSDVVHNDFTEIVDFELMNSSYKNNKYVFKTSFYILKDSNIECIIGRDTIKKHSLVSKFHRYFYENVNDNIL
jgi:hypothetical protein